MEVWSTQRNRYKSYAKKRRTGFQVNQYKSVPKYLLGYEVKFLDLPVSTHRYKQMPKQFEALCNRRRWQMDVG